jgi:hypothetical protein
MRIAAVTRSHGSLDLTGLATVDTRVIASNNHVFPRLSACHGNIEADLGSV